MFWQNLESDEKCSSVLSRFGMNRHTPVLVREVVEYLACGPGKSFLDLTAGEGGHGEAVLRATAPDGTWIGTDRDPQAIRNAGEHLSPFGSRVRLEHATFSEALDRIVPQAAKDLNGALIDCGVSSVQLEDAARGFSFAQDGPLDMRMDPSSGVTAREWLHRATEREIADAVFRYGEERFSRRIARRIALARKEGRLSTTGDLARAVVGALPPGERHKKIHPATRAFQAVRIAVNDELAQLEYAVARLIEVLPAGARLVVISFHSLEDRIAKTLFQKAQKEGAGRILTRKPVVASPEEVDRNPRARSAKLRALEILGGRA
ncbi:MAG: 16S rRNA (cytosine(1402)-N(4))-methyltransferase RsmH [Pseudomonadota bacterium]